MTESDTEQIVLSAFEARHSAKPYHMTCVLTDKSGTGEDAIGYTVERGNGGNGGNGDILLFILEMRLLCPILPPCPELPEPPLARYATTS